jgi:KaiC/GvpD/RAD55 family RecA-like ATPase
MTKTVKLKTSATRGVRLAPPRTRAVDPESVRRRLGAEPVARGPDGASPLVLGALRNALFASLRSSGGRPGLDGAVRRQKIPMSDGDWRVLEGISMKFGESGLGATPGQIAGQLLRDAISALRQGGVGVYQPPLVPGRPFRVCDIAGSLPPAHSGRSGHERIVALDRALSKAEKGRSMSDRSIVDLPVAGLDQLFFPRGVLLVDKGAPEPTTSIAVLGDTGAGKTTLAVALAHAVARELDGVALYVTTELASTELAYKAAFLGLEQVRVLRIESALDAQVGDILAQHLALVDSEPSCASGAEARALQAALNIAGAGGASLPTRCVVIDAFPFQASSSEPARHRDEVVGLVQTLEGRGVSVVVVQEAGSSNDYLPHVADIVLEARLEREPGTGEFARRVACRKSRYTRSLPGSHVWGTE